MVGGALAVQEANPGIRIIGVDLNTRKIETANQIAMTILGHAMSPPFQRADFPFGLVDLEDNGLYGQPI